MTRTSDNARTGTGTGVSVLGLALLLATLAVMIGAALGVRWDAWGIREAFGVIRWSAIAAAVVGLVALWGCLRGLNANAPAGIALGSLGVVFAVVLVLVPYLNWQKLRASPRLSDITTDMADPPAFVETGALREKAGARNSTAYSAEKAALQRRHYPDIRPVLLAMPPDRAFRLALDVVRDMNWTVVSSDPASGRIEAYDTSTWFGFVDDVAIRVTGEGRLSRIDVRSSSRVGRRDAGVNADRVRRFVRALKGPHE